MAIYVYRRASSTGARSLANALGATRIKRLELLNRRLRQGDTVVCWGESFTGPAGVRVLNGTAIQNKLTDAIRLREAGVLTIEVSRTRPQAVVVPPPPQPAPVDPAIAAWVRASELATELVDLGIPRDYRARPVRDGVSELLRELNALNAIIINPAPAAPPAPPVVIQPVGEWLPRSASHVGGNDLLNPRPNTADFWVKKENFTREFRVHTFNGKTIRAAVKVPRPDVANPHPWIRSWDGGWKMSYDGETVRQRHRDAAHNAVRALNLTFGAVDIGERADGTVVVLEVNRAPGLEGGTITKYADAVRGWIANGGN